MTSRVVSPIIAITVGEYSLSRMRSDRHMELSVESADSSRSVAGIISGVYVFKPLLESYADSTGGTFLPEKDDHSAPVPPLPMTNLLPNTGLPKEPPVEKEV